LSIVSECDLMRLPNFHRMLASAPSPLDVLEGLPRGAVRAYADAHAHRLALIDARVAPLVEVMNVPGVTCTIASCEGHRNWSGWCARPYVAFKAPVALAAQLTHVLRDGASASRSRLRLYWEITGHFDATNALVFRLTAAVDQRRWLRPVRRGDVDGDIIALRGILADAIVGYQQTMRSPATAAVVAP